ncbi:hypothetical protein AEGHOMDF_6129 [Methylobacterium soli]|nr:hypothetical protein AEGHOMDF_6129 [Methylobacterium soli]
MGELRDRPRGQPLGGAVDRLDRGQAREPGLVGDAGGMHHLALPVPEVDPARDVAVGAQGQHLLDARARHAEEHEADIAGRILDEDPVRAPPRPGLGRPVRHHRDADRHGLARGRLGDRALELARHAPLRQVEQQVDDAGRLLRRAQQALDQGRHLGADPRQAAGGREQRVEDARPQGRGRARRIGRDLPRGFSHRFLGRSLGRSLSLCGRAGGGGSNGHAGAGMASKRMVRRARVPI